MNNVLSLKPGRRGTAQIRAARYKSPTSYSPGTRKYSKKIIPKGIGKHQKSLFLQGAIIVCDLTAPEDQRKRPEKDEENGELVYLNYANGSIEHIEDAQSKS